MLIVNILIGLFIIIMIINISAIIIAIPSL